MTTPGSGPAPHEPWQQAPSGDPAYGRPPYGRAAYGYDAPPPAAGTAYPPIGYGPGYPAAGAYPPAGGVWGGPPGVVVIPGGPVLRAASPGRRTLARLIDSVGYLVLLAGALAGAIALAVHADARRAAVGDPYAGTDALPPEVLWFFVFPLVVVVIIVAYESLMIGLTGSTVGGRLMGVRFVRTRDGGLPGFGPALGRVAALAVSTAVCYGVLTLLLLLSMFFDPQPGRYQSWVDKLCGMQAVTTKG